MLRVTIIGLSTIPFRGVLPTDEALRTVAAVAGAPGVTITVEPAERMEPMSKPTCVLTLTNGVTIESDSDDYQAGAYVRILRADGVEIGYWVDNEWQDDPELVMGAILMCAMNGETKAPGVTITVEPAE